MVEWVRPLKLENLPDGGGMTDSFPTELKPTEDGINILALSLVDTTPNIELDGSSNLTFSDSVTGTRTLAQLAAAGPSALPDLSDVTITSVAEGQVLTYDLDTTQWVNRDKRVVTSVTTTYNADEEEVILCNSSGGAFDVNLPAAASNTNKYYMIKKTDTSSNSVTVDGNGSETIDGELTQALKKYDAIEIICDGTGWHII